MDSSPQPSLQPVTGGSGARLVGVVIFALALIGYGVLLSRSMGAYAGASDSSGYLNNARLLHEGRLLIPQRIIADVPPETASPYTYVPLGFIPRGEGSMVPTYPFGLPLLIRGLASLFGWDAAPGVTMWLHAMGGVLLMFALAREFGFSRPFALAGALLLAASPIYLFMSVQAMSDVPSLAWCIAAVLCAWRSRKKPLWALAAGLAVAISVLLRPSNLLVMVPVALALGPAWRCWLWLAVGGAPGAAAQMMLNTALYGQALSSGYGAVEKIFHWSYAGASLASYAQWLPVLLTPGIMLILAVPLFPWRGPGPRPALPVAWVLVFLGFYAFYLHTHEAWWYLRFLLPAFPALILLLLHAARALLSRSSPAAGWILGITLAAAILAWDGFWANELSALSPGRNEQIYPEAAAWLRAHLPDNAVIACMQASGSLLYYTDFTLVRWDQTDPARLARIEEACTLAGRPFYAVLWPFEIEDQAALGRLPGHWTLTASVDNRNVRVTIWKMASPAAAPAR